MVVCARQPVGMLTGFLCVHSGIKEPRRMVRNFGKERLEPACSRLSRSQHPSHRKLYGYCVCKLSTSSAANEFKMTRSAESRWDFQVLRKGLRRTDRASIPRDYERLGGWWPGDGRRQKRLSSLSADLGGVADRHVLSAVTRGGLRRRTPVGPARIGTDVVSARSPSALSAGIGWLLIGSLSKDMGRHERKSGQPAARL